MKKISLFSKKPKKPDKTQTMVRLIEKIIQTSPEKKEILEDIKIDLTENIPLSENKRKFLKNEIDIFKNEKTQPQITRSEDIKLDYDIPTHDEYVRDCTESLKSIEKIIHKVNEYSDSLYNESRTAQEEEKIKQLKLKNKLLHDALRNLISNLHITYSFVGKQINEAKSLQTKMSIFDNELDLKRNYLE